MSDVNLTVAYRMFLPRNRRSGFHLPDGRRYIDLVVPRRSQLSGQYSPSTPSTFHYRYNGSTGECRFMFWSFHNSGDGTFTSNDPDTSVHIGSSDMTATAWYIPLGGGGEQPGIEMDAFSDELDDFIDLTPIEHVSASGTWSPNTPEDNLVYTRHAVTITALPEMPRNDHDGIPIPIDAPQDFEHFLLFASGVPDNVNRTLREEQGASGYVIVTYRPRGGGAVTAPVFHDPLSGVRVLGLIGADGPGILIPIIGGRPPFPPVGPTGPNANSIQIGLAIHGLATSLSSEDARVSIQREALNLVTAEVTNLHKILGH